ncbi:porin [Vibrio sinensis]|uniref:Porin n=1 Tax=Vibrio sinensis TaxID=2302434 RepID=A0A3A6QF36_9VIBR|nr:porin [Vibrio sinensis]RJX70985.1 porin [Vibrio sinensis]
MKMKLLAIAVAATGFGTNVLAAEVYNSQGSTLSIGGYVDVGVGEYGDSTEVEVHDVSPRLNISGTQQAGNGVTVDAKGEWAINFLDGGKETFTTRLGYIGATHEQAGRLVAGTQWAPYYDVGGVADIPIAFANDFLYSNQGNIGSARADKMLSYRNTLNISNDVALNLGLGWQGKHDIYDTRGQIAISGEFMGFGLGYVYSDGDVGIGGVEENSQSHLVSANYGTYGEGVYAAVVYASNEYFYGAGLSALKDSSQYEGLLAYGLGNGLTLSVNYEAVEDDNTDKTQYSQSAIQAEYQLAPKLTGFAAFQFDLGNDIGDPEDDKWTIGARYYL